jgi:hypothetical protein
MFVMWSNMPFSFAIMLYYIGIVFELGGLYEISCTLI